MVTHTDNSDEIYKNSLIMSTNQGSDHSSPPILHFINTPNKTESSSPSSSSTTNNDEKKVSVNDENQNEVSPVQNNTVEQSTKNDDDKPIKTVSHSRRVHFPTDDSQLRIISYALEPSSNRPLVSLGMILQRYRAACQRLQLRPFNILLDQLSSMDDGRKSFADRLDCLKIINEKIDLKHIDAIEEILSRCRFHTLDFDSSSIDDIALTQLFDVLEYYESCTHINLSNNRLIGLQGYQALTKYLRKTSSLERLDMNSMRFDDNSILSFTRSLRLSSTLYELHVESCQLNGKILQKFIQNLRSCISLRELYLCDNRLQIQDSLHINELIRSCGQFLHLLDLRSNSLHDNGISHIASQLSHYDEHHTHENTLHKISFQSNQLTQQGAGFLAKALLHNRTIRSLNLSNNNITNEGLFLLREALLANSTVNELILRNCRLTDQAAIALAEFIAESSTIQYIDLRENTIQASGICGMAIAIKNNKSLLKLDFDPIVSTPTNPNSLANNNNNNIDRTTNSNSILSLTNLRKMTTGFGSFTSNTPFQSNIGGGGTRELLEQKARWMNDIAAVCQRNVLIYEEKLRLLEEEQQRNKETTQQQQQQANVIKPEDIELNEQVQDDNIPLVPTDVENPTLSEPNADIPQCDTTTSDNQETDQPLTIPIQDDNQTEEMINTSSNDNQTEEIINTSSNDNQTDEIINTSSNDNETEEIIYTSSNDNHEDISTNNATLDKNEVEQPTIDPNEIITNGDNLNQNSEISTSSHSADINDDDDKRKLHHSDSLYLMRKKVKNEDDGDTSDDESQLSSIVEHQDGI